MSGGNFDNNAIKKQIEIFEKKIVEPNFWKDKPLAQKILKKKKFITDIFNSFELVEN